MFRKGCTFLGVCVRGSERGVDTCVSTAPWRFVKGTVIFRMCTGDGLPLCECGCVCTGGVCVCVHEKKRDYLCGLVSVHL